MPFYYTQNAGDQQNYDPNTVICLIPGIPGNGSEFFNLITEIHQPFRQPKYPVFTYYDERLPQPNKLGAIRRRELSLPDHAGLIIRDIITKNLDKKHLIMVGNSFGCMLATLAAGLLKTVRPNCKVDVILIDSPAPTISKNHFKKNSDFIIHDLIKIVNYAARLAHLEPVDFSEEEIQSFSSNNDLVKNVNLIVTSVEQKQRISHTDTSAFYSHIEVIKQNLESIITYEHPKDFTKLDKLSLLLTNETRRKNEITNNTAGWEGFSNEVTIFENETLAKVSHTDLLKEENCRILTDYLYQKILQEKLAEILQNLRSNNVTNLEQMVKQTVEKTSPGHSDSDNSPNHFSHNNSPSSFSDEEDTADTMEIDTSNLNLTSKRKNVPAHLSNQNSMFKHTTRQTAATLRYKLQEEMGSKARSNTK